MKNSTWNENKNGKNFNCHSQFSFTCMYFFHNSLVTDSCSMFSLFSLVSNQICIKTLYISYKIQSLFTESNLKSWKKASNNVFTPKYLNPHTHAISESCNIIIIIPNYFTISNFNSHTLSPHFISSSWSSLFYRNFHVQNFNIDKCQQRRWLACSQVSRAFDLNSSTLLISIQQQYSSTEIWIKHT